MCTHIYIKKKINIYIYMFATWFVINVTYGTASVIPTNKSYEKKLCLKYLCGISRMGKLKWTVKSWLKIPSGCRGNGCGSTGKHLVANTGTAQMPDTRRNFLSESLCKNKGKYFPASTENINACIVRHLYHTHACIYGWIRMYVHIGICRYHIYIYMLSKHNITYILSDLYCTVV